MTTEEKTTAPVAEPAAPTPVSAPKKRKKRKTVRRIITVVIILAVVAAIAFAMWYFLFREKDELGDIMTATASISSIQSTVQGSGNARAGANSAITLTANGTIEEVFVNVGDIVYEGQPLYTAFSPEAEAQVDAAEKAISDQTAAIGQLEKNVETARKNLEKAQKDLDDLRGRASELTVRAPFAGKLTNVADVAVGQELAAGEHLATLVNDRRMKLTLYYSYAYENDISVGQSVEVSIPSLMVTLPGTVEEIHKVSFISLESGIFFEVDVGLDNPQTLTEGMSASAMMRTASGVDIYPYANGELKYSGTQEITATQPGKISSIGSLRNYANVSSGDTLLIQSDEAFNEQIEVYNDAVMAAQKALTAAEQAVLDGEAHLTELQEELTKAQQGLDNFDAVAPISGTVTSCTIAPGSEVTSGTTVITISDTSNMTVEITVDDRNIPFVTPGMNVDLSDWNGNTYIGTVTKINMEQSESGYSGLTSYPVTLSVDNMSGTLLQGMWLDYSFVTSESADCVTVPIQCVKSIVDTDGNPQTVVFLQAESAPENAVSFEPPEDDPYAYNTTKYPTPEEGYWPVPVETGLNDKYNVEIVSGLNAGDVVFSAYMMTGAWN